MIEAFPQGLGDSVGSCIPLQFGAGGTEKKKKTVQAGTPEASARSLLRGEVSFCVS